MCCASKWGIRKEKLLSVYVVWLSRVAPTAVLHSPHTDLVQTAVYQGTLSLLRLPCRGVCKPPGASVAPTTLPVRNVALRVHARGCVMRPVTFFQVCLLPAGESSSETISDKTLGVIMLYEDMISFRLHFT